MVRRRDVDMVERGSEIRAEQVNPPFALSDPSQDEP